MNSEFQEVVIFEALHGLSGLDHTMVLPYLSTAREQFDIRDSETLSFFKNADKESLKLRLSPNQFAYTDNKPLQESIFLYFDVSTSIELLNYVVHLRSIIDECIGAKNIRYSDLRLQHSTAFIDILGDDLGIDSVLLERVKSEYEPIIRTFLPFNLTIEGPHIFDTGGIVLEGVVHSLQFYKLREAASQKNSHVPKDAQRGIHNIVHSTIGYITNATSKQLIELYKSLETLRKKSVHISIRIRDGRIIATKNKRLVGQPIIIPFQGSRSNNLLEKDICTFLQKVRGLTPKWSKNHELRELVWEESLYWMESNHSASVQRLAMEIIDRC